MMCMFMIHLIFINKVEMISVAYYITFCCFTNNIFFIKYIAIMVMIMVFTFVVVMFTFVVMVLCSYYWISLFIFIYKMEMVPVSYDISCFCLTNNIFFIKYIPIFFMMFIRYWICSQCCSNRLLRIIFINKVEVIPMANNISHFIFFYNIIWIKDISIIFRTNCSCRSFLFINSICWRSSIYKMVVISMFF